MTKKLIKAMREAFRMTRQRCYNPSCADYKYYGGRGIRIHQPWLDSFDCFVLDMGIRPEGMTLERLDNDANYTPENCVWAPRKAQTRNRRETVKLTHEGLTLSLADWSERTGIPYFTLKARVRRLGYSAAEALSKEVKFGQRVAGKAYAKRKAPNMTNVPKGFARKDSVPRDLVRHIQNTFDAEGETYSSLAKKHNLSIEICSQICQRKRHFKDA